ncbi:MAG: hypothetical protein J6S11_01850 [Bacteroidaceae bacterium]|nr:hypothetical protein [Bacteroidaceae bacterium]
MKKNNVLAILCALLLGGSVAPLGAQERGDWSMTVGADAVSSFLWRGFDMAGPSVQPSAYIDYEGDEWSISMGAWGSKALQKGEYNEWDLSVEATWRNITLSLANYREYYGAAFDDNYLDLGLSFTLSEDIPVTFSWYSIVNHLDGGVWDGGDRFHWADAFPSYFEVSYDFSILEVVDCTVAAGVLPFGSDYYGNDAFGVCNLNLSAGHEFELKHGGTLPVAAQVMYNPMGRDCFWGVSVGYYFTWDW